MSYQQLTSEKYWLESIEERRELLMKQKRNRDIKSFAINCSALASVSAFVIGAVYTMPYWIETVAFQLKQWGLI